MSSRKTAWNTKDEINFLRYLATGRWKRRNAIDKGLRLKCLKGYCEHYSLYKKNWNGLESKKIIDYVDKAVKRER